MNESFIQEMLDDLIYNLISILNIELNLDLLSASDLEIKSLFRILCAPHFNIYFIYVYSCNIF